MARPIQRTLTTDTGTTTPAAGSTPRPSPPPDFCTLVAPGETLELVDGQWRTLSLAARLADHDPPVILPLSRGALPFAPGALRVAVLRHGRGIAPAVASRLSAALTTAGIEGVTVEEGYYLEPAGAPTAALTVTWDVRHLPRLKEPVPLALPADVVGAAFVGAGTGTRRVALIDSGDEGATLQYECEDHNFDVEPPFDRLGHGTAVGALLRLVAPAAEVHCFRVFRPREDIAESGLMMNAINEATLKSGEYAVVAIPHRASGKAKKGKQASVRRIVRHNAERGLPMPVVVCAAGNYKGEPISYPAVEPGFVVAVAADWTGHAADYNCRVPGTAQVFTVKAYGGTSADPLGAAARPGGKPARLYGSSYATALVAAAVAVR